MLLYEGGAVRRVRGRAGVDFTIFSDFASKLDLFDELNYYFQL